jgi:hypothetical protein
VAVVSIADKPQTLAVGATNTHTGKNWYCAASTADGSQLVVTGVTEDSLGRKDWDGVPPHKSSGNLPAGGNHLLVDGSAYWVKAQNMYFLHNWGGGWSSDRIAYFYKDAKDFDPALGQAPVLNSLKFRY